MVMKALLRQLWLPDANYVKPRIGIVETLADHHYTFKAVKIFCFIQIQFDFIYLD